MNVNVFVYGWIPLLDIHTIHNSIYGFLINDVVQFHTFSFTKNKFLGVV